jgi:MraZ protein
MELLTGEYNNTLDEKGRVSFPARFRNLIAGTTLIITKGVDCCLWVIPPEPWREFARKLMESASPLQKNGRMLQRRLIAPAQEVEIDKAGRIAIPQALREFAGLNKDCVILGIEKRIEIWDAAEYQAYLGDAGNEDAFLAAAEEFGDVFL